MLYLSNNFLSEIWISELDQRFNLLKLMALYENFSVTCPF